jgi:endonuclease/exonuclease/phosphatase family metal-dependent hydrolase
VRLLSVLIPFLLAGCASVSVSTDRSGGDERAPAHDPVRAATALLPDYAYPPGDTVRVATFNAEHFVDAFDDPYVDARRENEADSAGVAEKQTRFAHLLRALDADVVSLQEVEGEGVIRAFLDAHVPEMGYRFVASADDADWYQNVVVISRLPLGPLTTFADAVTPIGGQTDGAGRPDAADLVNHRLFAVEVYARPGYAFTLAAAHLKAGRSDRDEAWRAGQAALLHAWIGRRYGAAAGRANVVLAGDLNSVPGSPSFAALLNADGVLGPVPLADPLPDDGAFTHPADDPVRRLDHLLVSPGLRPEIVPGSVRVLRPLGGEGRALSDHLPVVLDLLARDR